MNRTPDIRRATPTDAAAISAVIVQTLRTSNAGDYPPTVIARVSADFSPDRVASLVAGRLTLVAVEDGQIVGTGALDGTAVRSVFILPASQGRGIGSALMAQIARLAAADGVASLTLRPSLTAAGFYARLGFRAMGEATFGEEKTVVMERDLHGGLAPADKV